MSHWGALVASSEQLAEARTRAQAAVDHRMTDRKRACVEAEAALGLAPEDPTVGAMAHRALATVAVNRGQFAEAAHHAAVSVDRATEAADGELLGWSLLTRMGTLAATGQGEQALVDSDRAEALLPPPGRVRLLIQRGAVLGRGLGRLEESIATFDQVEREFPQMEPVVEAMMVMNRGSDLLAQGDYQRATTDLERARHLYRQMGNQEAESEALLHQALAAARVGDFPTVFAIHAEVARRDLVASSDPRALTDLAEALLFAGLRHEAEDLSARALELDVGPSTTAASTTLRLAALRADLGRRTEALALCQKVASWAREQNVTGMVLTAELVEARITLGPGTGIDTDTDTSDRELMRLASELEAIGRLDEATEVRVELAQRALATGEPHRAQRILSSVPQPKRNVAWPELARLRHAEALRCLAAGDRGAALRQLSLGLDALDRMRASIEAIDLRAAATGRAPDLARLGIELVAASRRPRSLLRWSERQRAAALRIATGRNPTAPVGDLIDLRRQSETGAVREAEIAVARAARRQRRTGAVGTLADPAEIVAGVGDRTMVEFVAVGPRLDALVISRGRVRHRVGLGSVAEVNATIDRIPFGLRRLADPSAPRAAAAARLVEAMAAQLDQTLFGSLPAGSDELIIIPSGHLHLLPWATLPSLVERPFSVAPSAHLWLQAAHPTTPSASTVLLHGPDLPHAAAELDDISHLHQGQAENRALVGVAGALDALGSAGTVHLAAHGTFRVDNAQFSALRLSDGPLYIYDLDGLSRLPSLVVLSSCSVGTLGVLPGDEVLGFPAALLARGAASVIAAVLPVEDLASRELMVELHRRLAVGDGPAAALRGAAQAVAHRGPLHRMAAASFVLYGQL